MRAPVLIPGVVLLAVGISLTAVVLVGGLPTATRINTFNQTRPGEYVSSEMILNVSSIVVVNSPPVAGGLIPAHDLSAVNSSNIGSYSAPVNQTVNSPAGVDTYTSMSGDFYYVVFSSVQPSTQIVVTEAHPAGMVDLGPLAPAGPLLIIAGFIVTVAGVRLNRTEKSTDSVRTASSRILDLRSRMCRKIPWKERRSSFLN